MKNGTAPSASNATKQNNSPTSTVQQRLNLLFIAWHGSCSLGIGLFACLIPNFFMNFLMTKSYDGVHLHMFRCIASVVLGQALMFVHWIRSSDDACSSTVLFNRLSVSILTIAACYNAISEDTDSLLQHSTISWFMIISCIDIVLCVTLLLLNRAPVGLNLLNPERRLVLCLTHLDFIASLAVGSLWFAMPKWLLRNQVRVTLNVSHEFVSRIFGAYLLGTGIFSLQSIYFQSEADRQGFVRGRTLICGFILSAQVYSQFAYAAWWKSSHWIGIALFSVWSTLAAFAFVRESLWYAQHENRD